jgi:hypothetical protein
MSRTGADCEAVTTRPVGDVVLRIERIAAAGGTPP